MSLPPDKPPRKSRWHKPLDPDDVALWDEVKKTVKRLPRTATKPRAKKAKSVLIETVAQVMPPMAAINAPEKKAVRVQTLKPALVQAASPVEIDRQSFRKIKTGRVMIEDSLDLHGMRQDSAHRALEGFLDHAIHRGYALVLVVTGKGERIYAPGTSSGILRKNVPIWLSEGRLSSLVVSFRTAALNHGGEGAYYVRLRKKKK